jgi:putative oligomerization/nucleic acid binding protein
MFGRRRPLVRAAVVGGAAYHIGKKNAQNQQAQQDEADQQAQADQQAANEQTSAGSKGGESNANFDELTKLQKLHDNGVLTDDEYADAKQKVIAKM